MAHLKDQSAVLSLLCRAPAEEVKALADQMLPALVKLGSLEVVHNRTGLVMLPYRDTVQGTPGEWRPCAEVLGLASADRGCRLQAGGGAAHYWAPCDPI